MMEATLINCTPQPTRLCTSPSALPVVQQKMETRDWTRLLPPSRLPAKLIGTVFDFALAGRKKIYKPNTGLLTPRRASWLLVATTFCLPICSTFSVGQAAEQTPQTDSQYLYGTWYTYPPSNPPTDSLRHEFRHNRATDKDEIVVTHLCQGDYRAVIARATSPIQITPSTIRVLKHSADSQKGELGSECKSSVEPGLWSYTISEDHNRLTITNPGGTPDIVELARQDAATTTLLPSTLYGTWLFPSQNSGDIKKEVRLVFYNNADSVEGKVREMASCVKGNSALASQVEANIRVSADVITILNSASNAQKKGPFTCEVTITSGSLHYVVSPSGSTLKIRGDTGPSMTLTRGVD